MDMETKTKAVRKINDADSRKAKAMLLFRTAFVLVSLSLPP